LVIHGEITLENTRRKKYKKKGWGDLGRDLNGKAPNNLPGNFPRGERVVDLKSGF